MLPACRAAATAAASACGHSGAAAAACSGVLQSTSSWATTLLWPVQQQQQWCCLSSLAARHVDQRRSGHPQHPHWQQQQHLSHHHHHHHHHHQQQQRQPLHGHHHHPRCQHHAPQHQHQALRWFRASAARADLREFLDAVDPQSATYGRAWRASELRNKSWDDLHKLWYVCLKERNMLLTQMGWEVREQAQGRSSRGAVNRAAHITRLTHVKKTMNRIKQVLSERAHNEGDATRASDMKKVIHYM